MKIRTVRAIAFCLCFSPLAIQAQTWVGGSSGNVFNVAANWSPAGVPGSNASLTFSGTTNLNVGFNNLPYTANSLTFTSSATNQFFINGNGSTLTLNGGITTQSGSGGANFSSGINIALGANQTWTTASTVTVNSTLSGAFSLTKAGTGNLILSGNNTYSGGTTVSAGGLYLGNSNSSSGTIAVGASGTLGAAFGDVALGNAISLASGATIGGSTFGDGSVELSGTVTLSDPTATLNVAAKSDAFFSGTLTAAGNTALTVQSDGTGVAILAGSTSNVTNITANNSAVVFANTSALSGSLAQIHATNGGYVSVGTLSGVGAPTPPSVSSFLALITDKANFDGVIGLDTDDEAAHPAVYSTAIDLTGFNANTRIGSITSAVLTGAITPVGQTYKFGGFAAQDGLLVVKSDLTEQNSTTTNVSLSSPAASGGAPQNGMVLVLQGTGNNFTGDIDVSYSSLVLDSATPGTAGISLGAYSYAGYTEGAGFGTSSTSFGNFLARITGSTSTSILGIDSQDVIDAYVDSGVGTSTHTLTGAVNLGGFSSIYLGTLTGATISNTATITAPTDGTLRLVNMGGEKGFTIETVLNQSNGLVVGMNGSEGAVILANNNTFGGNTTLAGGQLLVGDTTTSALSSGSLTVTAPTAGDLSVLGTALGSASLANNITVTGTTLRVGTGGEDESTGNFLAGGTTLALSGAISGTGGLEITGLTTLSGTNTYTGGTTIRANTTVSNNSGLGTGSVFVGYSDNDGTPVKSTLTFTTSAPTIGFLSDASLYTFNGGTGDINMTGASPTLTITQTGPQSVGTFSGQFTGNTVAIVKAGTGQLALTGANAGQITSVSITGGSFAIGDSLATSATFDGNVALNGGGLFFRPGSGQTLTYNGNITGTTGGVTVNGNSSGITHVTGGSSTFTGSTSINSGTLRIGGDNFWSSASATTVNGGTTLQLDGNQTIRNLSGTGTVNVATGGKILTVDSASNTTFGGGITGSGGLTKAGGSSFTLSSIGGNTYTGNTIVSAGTLVVNGALSSPSVTVNSSAFLQGTGTLNDLVLNGTFQPGTASGFAGVGTLDSLTMSSTGLLHMELGGTAQGSSYDYLNITNGSGGTGAFNVGGTLSVTFINSFNPVSGNSFNLFDFTSLTGTFGTLNLQPLTAGLSWDTSTLYTTGVLSVTGTAIPEPSTYAVIAGAGALILAAWRRRSARAVVQVAARY